MNEPMTISQVLESEHRWLDGQFEKFQDLLAGGQVDGEPFEEAAKVLHRHIYVEEEIVFPEVEARGLAGPVAVMLQEHGDICRLLHEIQDSLERKASPSDIQNSLKAVRSVLEEHNVKEEGILYPSADRLLAGPELAQIVQRIREAEMPDGWACRAHSGS